jgi:hypothetical protein
MSQHRLRWIIQSVALSGLLAVSNFPVHAQTPADNTKVNTRDRAKGAVPQTSRRKMPATAR